MKGSVARRKNFIEYHYEPCKETSYGFQLLSKRIKFWPDKLMEIYERRKKKKKLIFPSRVCQPYLRSIHFTLKSTKILEKMRFEGKKETIVDINYSYWC